jgi:WD40 repeat protein
MPPTVVDLAGTALAGNNRSVVNCLADYGENPMPRTQAVLLCAAAYFFLTGSIVAQTTPTKNNAKKQSIANSPAPLSTNVDSEGEPMPVGVLARLGSVRWRHGGRIIGSALSSDGKRLATVSPESVAVWDIDSGKILFRFPGLTQKERSEVHGYYSGPGIVSFSPDGKWLGAAYLGDRSGVWNLANGGKFRKFGTKDDFVCEGFCHFTPDSKEVVFVHNEGACFWNLASGKAVRKTPAADVLDFSADGRIYIRMDRDRDNAISVRDSQTNKILMEFVASVGYATPAFAPDGKTLVLVDDKKKEMQVWDVRALKPRLILPTPESAVGHYVDTGDEYLRYCVRFSPNSKQLLMGTRGGKIHRWDLETRKELPALGKHLADVVTVHASPEGKFLVSTESNGLIRRWDTVAQREISDLGNYQGGTHAVLSPDGHLAAVSDGRGRVDLWDMRSAKILHTLRREGPAVSALTFTPDGKTLAIGLETGTASFCGVASGREVKAISFKKIGKELDFVHVLSTMLISPDGRLLFAYRGQSEYQMWDLAKGEARWHIEANAGWPSLAAFSANSNTLALLPGGPKISILDARTGNQRRIINLKIDEARRGPACVDAIALAPDGRRLAAALSSGEIALVDIEAGIEMTRFPDDGFCWPLAFSPDGNFLAACGVDAVNLRDAYSGIEVLRLNGHRDSVQAISFSPDGRRLLSSGDDSQVYFWSLRPKALTNSKRALESIWLELGAEDGPAAYRAVWELSDEPNAVDFLRAKIAPVKAIDRDNVANLVAYLNSSNFQKRHSATKSLAQIGEPAISALEEAHKSPPSAEVRQRIGDLLQALRMTTLAQMQQLRAVKAMELVATPSARRLLQDWSAGAEGCRLTESARAAVSRLSSLK